MKHSAQLVLASASERRVQLLEQMGLYFRIEPASLDESYLSGESAKNYTRRLAIAKAEYVWQDSDKTLPVLGADTIVAMDGDILGKPDDDKHAVDTLMRLSGRMHEVITAVCVVSSHGQDTQVVSTEIQFMDLTRAQCEAYCRTGEPRGKAGGYAIQGLAGSFVCHLKGSYSAVVGLPLYETAELLARAGVQLPARSASSSSYE